MDVPVRNGAADAVATPATMPPVANAVITIFFTVCAMVGPSSLGSRTDTNVPISTTTLLLIPKAAMN